VRNEKNKTKSSVNKQNEESATTISFVVPPFISDLVEKVAKGQGTDKSSFCRRLIYIELGRLSYLDEEQKKALGLLNNKNEVTTNVNKDKNV